MKIIAQGLRRSGTTVLFDIFEEDKRFYSFYEPLSRGKRSVGGGSKIKKKDYMEGLRSIRKDYLKASGKDPFNFNYGAPFDYRLEARPGRFPEKGVLPENIKEYLGFLINSNENTFLKFTRGTFFIRDFYEIAPDAVFVHIYKDPIRFVQSHLCYQNNFLNKDSLRFFSTKSGFNNWSQEYIVNDYIAERKPEYSKRPAYFKLLYLWKTFNDIIEKDGRKYFGKRYFKVANESIIKNYPKVLNDIYSINNLRPTSEQLNWCRENLRSPKEILFKGDFNWEKAFLELGI